jgi:predicted ATP-grasp superfamily ATP-dependent carboligase
MRILLLEFASCTGTHPSLLPEGFAMLRLLAGEFEEAGFRPLSLLHRSLRWLAPLLPGRVEEGSLPPPLHPRPDAVLLLAPPGELVELTGWLERRGVKVLGTGEEGARLAGDKWLSYLRLKGEVRMPPSRLAPPSGGRWVVKPRWGAGGEGVRRGRKRDRKEFFQRFVEGIPASCCLLAGEGVKVLSLNRQMIRWEEGRVRYLGSRVPLELSPSLSRETGFLASRAARLLKARGLCGADLVVGKRPCLLELNPRLTTSFLALERILRGNLAEMLVEGRGKEGLRGKAEVRILRAPPLPPERALRAGEREGILAPPLPTGGEHRMVVVGWGKGWEEVRERVEEARREAGSPT